MNCVATTELQLHVNIDLHDNIEKVSVPFNVSIKMVSGEGESLHFQRVAVWRVGVLALDELDVIGWLDECTGNDPAFRV